MSPAVSCVHHAPCDSRRPAHHAHHAPTPAAVVVLRPPRAPLAMLPQSCKRHTRPAHSVNHTTHAHAMDEVRPWWQGLAAAPGGDGGGCCWRRRRRRCWEASPRRDRRPGGIAGGHDARPSAIGPHRRQRWQKQRKDDVGWDAAHALTARPRCSHVSLAQSSAAPPGGSSKPQRAIVRVVVSRDGV